MNMKKTVE